MNTRAKIPLILGVLGAMAPAAAQAWTARVTGIIQHGTQIAVYLSPDPGPLSCAVGQPYLMNVDDSAAAKQRFAMLMTALTTGQSIQGWDDGCNAGIWGQSRPHFWRLQLNRD
jgi:hypothetical protein